MTLEKLGLGPLAAIAEVKSAQGPDRHWVPAGSRERF